MKKSYIVAIVVVIAVVLGGGLLTGLVRDGYMIKIQNAVKNSTVEKYVMPLINYGYMSGTVGVIDSATVGLEVDKFVVDPDEIPNNGDEYYANVIDQCIFHSNDSFDPLCVVCKLKDSSGNVIGAGIKGESFDQAYIGSTSIEIDIEPDPENIQSNDVQKVHDVEVFVCAPPGGEGCTPGYWRQEQHFGSWISFSPVDPMTPFRDAFMIGDTDITGDPIVISMKSNGGGGKASQLVDNPGNPNDDITLLDAIWAQGGNENKMGRHATASLLNAANPDVNFDPVLTELEIKRLVQVSYGTILDANGIVTQGDFNQIGDIFAVSNDLGEDTCPLSLNPLPEGT